jgi:hypothetical protein
VQALAAGVTEAEYWSLSDTELDERLEAHLESQWPMVQMLARLYMVQISDESVKAALADENTEASHRDEFMRLLVDPYKPLWRKELEERPDETKVDAIPGLEPDVARGLMAALKDKQLTADAQRVLFRVRGRLKASC